MTFKILDVIQIIVSKQYSTYSDVDVSRIFRIIYSISNGGKRIICIRFINFAMEQYCNGNITKAIECFYIIRSIVDGQNWAKLDNRFYEINIETSYERFLEINFSKEEQNEYNSFIIFLNKYGFIPTEKFKRFIPQEVLDFFKL